MSSRTEKFLIIGPSWVGDMIMSQSLFITIRQKHPDCQIDVLAPDWTRPLLERMPEVNEAISMPIGHGQLAWGERKAIGRSLRNRGYDQCLVIPNSLKSALIPFFARIPVRTGWLKEPRYILLNDLRRLDKQVYPLMLQRLNALAYPTGADLTADLPHPKLVVEQACTEAAMERLNLSSDKPILILCPGAEFGSSKRWPVSHYASLASHYLELGWQVWLFGSTNDRPVCEQIQQQAKQTCINLAGETSLAEAIDLMSLASLVVTNDSGLMHMAAALDRPLVAVYGSTSPEFTPPLSPKAHLVQQNLECSPCFKRDCPLGHQQCMQGLLPADVITASEQAIGSNS